MVVLASALALAACSSTSMPTVSSASPAAAGSTSSGAALAARVPAATSVVSASPLTARTSTAAPVSTSGGADPISSAETTRASLSTVPARTVPVAAPSGGNIRQTVRSSEVTTGAAVPLTGRAQVGGGISASISGVTRISAVAHRPGEISGPAVSITLKLKNGSSRAVDLSQVTVTVADHAGLPAPTISQNDSNPLANSLAAGRSVSGVYVFSLPAKSTDPISISVTVLNTAPVVLFVGDSK